MKKSKKNELRYNEDDERTLLEDILDFVKVFVHSAIVILLFVELCGTSSSCRWRKYVSNIERW